jgi:hypothetical protein
MDNPQSDAYLTAGKDALKAILHPAEAFAWCVVSVGRMMASVEFNHKKGKQR